MNVDFERFVSSIQRELEKNGRYYSIWSGKKTSERGNLLDLYIKTLLQPTFAPYTHLTLHISLSHWEPLLVRRETKERLA